MTNVFQKELMHVGEMASGVKLTVPVYSYKPNKSTAPNVYIQANMHGAEVQGNAVIFQLLELLKYCDIQSNVTLIPYANPIACNHKNGEYTLGRFDPITGVNWNRMYHFDKTIIASFVEQHIDASDAEIQTNFEELLLDQIEHKLDHNIWGLTTGQRIAYQLQRKAHQADLVLDLHTGPISSKHLYCPEYAKASANYFNIPHTIFIPNDFDGAMDEATVCPWWDLQQAFESKGRDFIMGEGAFAKESFTVELGSQEQIDLVEAHEDALSILSYLQHKSVITGNNNSATLPKNFLPQTMTRYACYLKDYKTLHAPMGGMVDYLAEFGEPLAAGEPLVRFLRMDNYSSEGANLEGGPLHNICLDSEVLPILHFASASVNQGTELYKVFINYFEI